MTPDQLLLDETHAWLARARGDLEAAQLLIQGHAYAEALFHCQQAAEKALKGFLTFYQKPFRKTHDLSELGPACAGIDASLESVLQAANDLTNYAWQFRYPGAPREPEETEATTALQKAGAVLREIEQRLTRKE